MTCGHGQFTALHVDREGLADLVTCVCRRCLHTWSIHGAEHADKGEMPAEYRTERARC